MSNIMRLLLVFWGYCVCAVGAFSPNSRDVVNPLIELQKKGSITVQTAFAAFTIASTTLSPIQPVSAYDFPSFEGSSIVVSEKVIREGLYQDYEIDVQPQQVDDARSTFKAASETKSNKGKYTALLAILIVGSFIIPMAQYFWYVRDDDSSDQYFSGKNAKKVPDPPKKKSWFN